MKEQTIIVPSALFWPLWGNQFAAFFDDAGVSYRVGPVTDHSILELGLANSCEGFCLPLKIFCGHVAFLAAAPDARILIPVITGTARGNSFLCHLQQRARDIVVDLGIVERSRLASPFFEYGASLSLGEEGFRELGEMLGVEPETARMAARKAASLGVSVPSGPIESAGAKVSIALCAHPAIRLDPLLGGRISNLLAGMGAKVIDPDTAAFTLDGLDPGEAHFSLSARTASSVFRCLEEPSVDGVVYLQAFQCGPDASIARDASKRAKGAKPFLPLVLDQNLSDGAIITRLEAFMDILLCGTNEKNPPKSRVMDSTEAAQ